MRMRAILCLVAVFLIAGSVYAELQNVVVGGQIELRGRWYHNAFESGVGPAAGPTPTIRIAPGQLPRRVTGQSVLGQSGVLSLFRYNDVGHDWSFYENATSLNVAADFTDNVAAFIEFYSFNTWGSDFRSNYTTGVDVRGAAEVELLQSYIEVNELFDQPVRLRVGRQVMQFGKDLNAFLLAGKSSPTQRFAYDGIRLTATPLENLTVDAWMMKLAETSPIEQDGDADFYGIHASYKCCDALTIAPFWYFIRDARRIADTNGGLVQEWVEDLVGLDDYPVTAFHTVGVESSGKYNAFDYSLRVAYQWGDAGRFGSLFNMPVTFMGNRIYGDDDAEYDNWGMDAVIGYTFADTAWKFRPYILGAYYQGEDDRDVSFLEWLNPFRTPKASVSFNRLFSDVNYAPVINDNADMTNFKIAQLGVTMKPTEKLMWQVRAYNVWADETFKWPAYVKVPRTTWWQPTGRLLIAPFFSFWDKDSSDNLGFTLDTVLKYDYSQDLTMFLYYGHLWTGDGLRDGAYINSYGNMFNGGLNDDGADYLFWWSILKF